MRILYLGAFRFPNGDAASQRVLNNAKILRELGCNIQFLSWGGEPRHSDKCVDSFYYYQGFKYFNTHEIDNMGLNLFKRIWKFIFQGQISLRVFTNLLEESDIIIAYNPSAYFTKKMLSFCNKHNKKFIVDITEWYGSNEFPGGKFALPFWLNEWNMRFIQKRVKNKILISSFLEKYYRTSWNIILPPLVDVQDEKWMYKKQVLTHFDGIRIIYAGTPAKKDLLQTMLEVVISCVKSGMKLQFVVVGVSIENILKYTNYQEILSFQNNIIFCGKVSQLDVPLYYQVSDFSLLIRDRNRKSMAGFPTKFAESLISGIPVIVNSTSDLDQYIIQGENGFIIDDNKVHSLKTTLHKINELSKEEIELMKTKARKTGETQFDYRNYVKKVQLFLNKIEY